jgi:hypothetical protein
MYSKAGSLLSSLLMSALLVGPAAAQNQDGALKTSREWKRLSAQAHTEAEFHQLAQWCQTQMDLYKKKAAGYEAELKEYYASPSARPVPKYPPVDQNLKTLIAHYRDLSKHWEEMADLMIAKAMELAAADAHK